MSQFGAAENSQIGKDLPKVTNVLHFSLTLTRFLP
jgi:hypothetical protein